MEAFDKITLAVFDMAGTTINEDNLVYKTLHKALEKVGCSATFDRVLALGAGKDKRNALADLLDEEGVVDYKEALVEKAYGIFIDELHKAYESAPMKAFDGVSELFSHLRSLNIAVVLNTGYDKVTAQKILDRMDWQTGRDIDALITRDDVNRGRPHPDMIELAMKLFHISDAKEVLKAGDSEVDILEGINAGCGINVGVLSGAQTREQLSVCNPHLIVDSVAALKAYF